VKPGWVGKKGCRQVFFRTHWAIGVEFTKVPSETVSKNVPHMTELLNPMLPENRKLQKFENETISFINEEKTVKIKLEIPEKYL
jgi:hypothetical protein